MELLIFRHGIAEPAEGFVPDAERALTTRGMERTGLAAQGLAHVADRPQVILTSPKVRAGQTARILGDLFDLVPESSAVLGDGGPAEVLAMLRGRKEDRVLIVGHEPTLSGLVELVCAGQRSQVFIDMKKAACALVDAPLRRDEPRGPGTLVWLLPPRVLRALAESR